ncbi:MAG: hypothetical protein ACRDU4_09320 [Mycobacterium sp.]
MDLPSRLADILAQHAATMRGIDGLVDTRRRQPERRDRRVLLPADQQRGCTPPRIQVGSSWRNSST